MWTHVGALTFEHSVIMMAYGNMTYKKTRTKNCYVVEMATFDDSDKRETIINVHNDGEKATEIDKTCKREPKEDTANENGTVKDGEDNTTMIVEHCNGTSHEIIEEIVAISPLQF